MKNYLLWIRYDGTRFHGWQRQAAVRTVQGELERALARLVPDYRLGTSSRTDAGVHALRHPVNVLTSSAIPPLGLLKGLNALLPNDMAVVDIHAVPADFRSRKLALGKVYRYRLDEGRRPDPFLDPYAWRVKRPLDLTAMRAAAEHLLGEHDFSAFRAADCDAPSARRLVTGVYLVRHGRLLTVTIAGNAFLRNMVRIMVGTLVEVGKGRRPPAWVGEVLDAGDRTRAGMTAPARGLTLVGVVYPTQLLCDGAHGW